MPRFKIFVPLRKRVYMLKKSIIPKLPHKHIEYIVNEGETEEYKNELKALGREDIEIKEAPVIGKTKKLNWIIKNLWEGEEFNVFLDDDVTGYNFIGGEYPKKLSAGEVLTLFVELYRIANILKFKVASVCPAGPIRRREHLKPITYKKDLNGQTMILLDRERLFDTKAFVFEDYEYFLRSIYYEGGILRNELYSVSSYKGKCGQAEGGYNGLRNRTNVEDSRKHLINKFGVIAQKHFRRRGGFYG